MLDATLTVAPGLCWIFVRILTCILWVPALAVIFGTGYGGEVELTFQLFCNVFGTNLASFFGLFLGPGLAGFGAISQSSVHPGSKSTTLTGFSSFFLPFLVDFFVPFYCTTSSVHFLAVAAAWALGSFF